ncbi:phosphoribosylformylglycinamidine synthase subunit PurS [Metabacillus sp. RGM 3146]|uniref:phosphoribosylformylglycinamidine synthase subunit PurS n=1 Tax=Metabacillus sp. RGM 3146 TaxID=3401092 RepID=UPI003B99EE80
MYKVKVYVTLRESILDPQGKAVNHALHSMGYGEVEDVRLGKFIELTVKKSDRPLDETVEEMCRKLLANTVIEDYRFEVEEVVAQ